MDGLKEFFSGKIIIFFSVQTFNLEKQIKEKLENLGARVMYYDERPSNSNFTKGIIRLKRSFYQNKINKYYQNILNETKKQHFDFLFVNRGEVITPSFLDDFKKSHPTCFLIFYTWDSFTNHVHPTSILKFFDRKLSFDPEDSKKYNINYRPLFFLDNFKNLVTNSPTKIKLLFLGTAHSDRHKISTIIKKWCNNNGLSCYCYYFMHGRLVYFYKKIFDKTFNEFRYKHLSFKSLLLPEILELYKNSDVILDINHPNQKGLTMRTFEALGSGKKLITTNQEIKKFPFFNSNNVYLVNRKEIKLDFTFFNSPYTNPDEKMYNRFTMEGWLYNIFVDPETDYWNKII